MYEFKTWSFILFNFSGNICRSPQVGTEEFYNKAKSGNIELFVKALWKVYGCR
jgi:hypothetical protein